MSPQCAAVQTDEELLECFTKLHEEEAFAALVKRHGAMVLGVCLRLLHHRQDAEDAFQATFLTLCRKGHTIRQRGALASWLYRVAFRIALRLKARTNKQQSPEVLSDVPVESDPSAAAAWSELRPALDQEVQRLPQKYRAPMILCYLEGKTYEEVAAQLGCPKGTVAIRLLRGRQMLKDRLVRRGLMAAAGCVGAMAFVPNAGAAVPPALAVSTIAHAMAVVSGAAIGQVVPAAIAGLVAEATKIGWIQSLKVTVAVAACVSLVGFSLSGGVLSAIRQATPTNSERVARNARRTDAPLAASGPVAIGGHTAEPLAPSQNKIEDKNPEDKNPRDGLAQAEPIVPDDEVIAPRTRMTTICFSRERNFSVVVVIQSTFSNRRPTTGLAVRERLGSRDNLLDRPMEPMGFPPGTKSIGGEYARIPASRTIIFIESGYIELLDGFVRISELAPLQIVKPRIPCKSVLVN